VNKIELPKVYTAKEAAEILRVSRETVQRYLYTGQLKGAKVGKCWRITEAALNDLLERGTEPNYLRKLPHPGSPIGKKRKQTPEE
jgi:excisionase family DNA binding protein